MLSLDVTSFQPLHLATTIVQDRLFANAICLDFIHGLGLLRRRELYTTTTAHHEPLAIWYVARYLQRR